MGFSSPQNLAFLVAFLPTRVVGGQLSSSFLVSSGSQPDGIPCLMGEPGCPPLSPLGPGLVCGKEGIICCENPNEDVCGTGLVCADVGSMLGRTCEKPASSWWTCKKETVYKTNPQDNRDIKICGHGPFGIGHTCKSIQIEGGNVGVVKSCAPALEVGLKINLSGFGHIDATCHLGADKSSIQCGGESAENQLPIGKGFSATIKSVTYSDKDGCIVLGGIFPEQRAIDDDPACKNKQYGITPNCKRSDNSDDQEGKVRLCPA